ncbi:TDP-fucosamine acetyltransferase [Gimesia alba]|uniref:TDP-fucosamine acetyltransferase n=1 Tax=Gimesia alba TaxID=2527973 RepID=A0A517RGP9_9PLAN|nr:hypothetical protein [Gimesia alba]QDT43051.1 TDP-fucosamine acetyltransferase [Gimesia alba]
MNSHQTELQQRALDYSPVSFLRGYESEISRSILENFNTSKDRGDLNCLGSDVRLWYRKLEWDSNYFQCPIFRIDFVDWDEDINNPQIQIAEIIQSLQNDLKHQLTDYYLFAEVPSEDTVVLQALGLAGIRLIETRITHYQNQLELAENQTRQNVRIALESDIPNLREVAIQAKNEYDRFHADPFFSTETADQYIAEYVEQCVRGLTDVVLVPDVDAAPPGAFVCGSAGIETFANFLIGRLVLVAVSESRRGWYRWLNSALMDWMRQQGMSCIVNTTQSTNRAVIHVCETLGYKYGRSTHIYAAYNKQ